MTSRFQPTVDIWTLTEEQRAALQVGQWVQAGPRSTTAVPHSQPRAVATADFTLIQA